MARGDRGFGSMDRTRQREIASKGGRAAHEKGTAHEWTSEEAKEAGRKGGLARRARGETSAPAEVMPPTHPLSSEERWTDPSTRIEGLRIGTE